MLPPRRFRQYYTSERGEKRAERILRNARYRNRFFTKQRVRLALKRRRETQAGGLRLPRIEDRDAEGGKVLRVARHGGQAMFNGGCGYHAACGVGRGSARLTRGIEHAPTLCNRLRDRQGTRPEPERNFNVNKLFQRRALAACGRRAVARRNSPRVTTMTNRMSLLRQSSHATTFASGIGRSVSERMLVSRRKRRLIRD